MLFNSTTYLLQLLPHRGTTEAYTCCHQALGLLGYEHLLQVIPDHVGGLSSIYRMPETLLLVPINDRSRLRVEDLQALAQRLDIVV